MIIQQYEDKYKNQVIALILYLQNFDNRVNLSLEEQPDMNHINEYYLQTNGGFWIAIDDNGDVVGTLGLLNKYPYGVLKKFFVDARYRGREGGVSGPLYAKLLEHAKKCHFKAIVLDTPAACKRAHGFYKKMGYKKITKDELPVQYDYPERDSDLLILKLENDSQNPDRSEDTEQQKKVEMILEEADQQAATTEKLSHETVFSHARDTVNGK